ncbi:hypothetical protein BIFLH277_01733 [Bifidobacterium longum subsp. longum]|nr:hypothetical protein BIFLH206_01711 [Bifidobacterium longum subsp. longum]VWQ37707.1 hypothetical protein BIFLH277_01733 [Bifidobacterium longum subsp. longum]
MRKKDCSVVEQSTGLFHSSRGRLPIAGDRCQAGRQPSLWSTFSNRKPVYWNCSVWALA